LGYALIFAEAKEANANPVVRWQMFNIMVRLLQTEEIETILQFGSNARIEGTTSGCFIVMLSLLCTCTPLL
jgi:hypothetical protein